MGVKPSEDFVSRDIVLRALSACVPPHCKREITVSLGQGNPPDCWDVKISDGKTHMVFYVPPETSRRTINDIVRRFDIPKFWFYEPMTIPVAGPIN